MQTNIQKDSKIAVLCGGFSSEREISMRSGKNCFDALLRLGYSNAELVEVDENIAAKIKNYDVAYIALHGKYGEDGCIQGLLELLKIPYTGCGVMSSAIAMNKEYTKKILRDANLPLIKSVCVTKGDNLFEKTKDLSYPLMVKPVCEGSSFGMSKVDSQDELVKAIFDASQFNQDILIEEYKVGISTTVGVLEKDGEAFATDILELRPHNEWYDYEAKYTKGMTDFILPAEISEEMTQKVKKYAIKAFNTCACSGVSRIDFHIVDDIPYILEINTSPGMTDTSDLPAQSASMGISYDELVELILKSAGLNK
ncbi:MAG: D-alanine--D-alanine ligase [Candidatus Gastranaerophilales bacterium]|nr:D-alanine--D-alanine ligase [Candidatus Gastranaerophilales bacterium]